MKLLPTIAAFFSAIDGRSVLTIVVHIIVIGLVWWLLTWLIDYVKLPDPFTKIAKVILAVAAVIFLINAILTLVGSPFIRW